MMDLRFGIPSIDKLINPAVELYPGISAQPSTADGRLSEPWVLCILGPDGVGKSILGLHAASTFWLDSSRARLSASGHAPAIFYVSTDLKYSQAFRTWTSFGLDLPAKRACVFQDKVVPASVLYSQPYTLPRQLRNSEVNLAWIAPVKHAECKPLSGPRSIEAMVDCGQWNSNVYFLDLASHAAGDDWTLINRLAGFLTDIDDRGPHLMVVDAVEGLEALVGEHDPHGQQRTRRSRIAQLIRMAKRANCHIVLVIEEGVRDSRLPEEFMADLVVRIRAVTEHGYDRRTIEVEKARGVSHVRGQHDVAIRSSGAADKPGKHSDRDVDEPRLVINHNKSTRPIAYLHAFPSIHARDRAADLFAFCVGSRRKPFFGIPHLDNVVVLEGADAAGVPGGSLTVMVGDTSTYKSRLGRAFLANAFGDLDAQGRHSVSTASIRKRAALLVTTSPITQAQLADRIVEWNGALQSHRSRLIEQVVVRHVTPHFRTLAEFLYMLDRNVDEALRKANARQASEAHRVRVVLDDWGLLLAGHPNLAADSSFLSIVVLALQRYGVTSLLIGSQSGIPVREEGPRGHHDLRNVETRQLYTWPVPFFGDRRVAVTTFPAVSAAHPPLVYELKPSERFEGRVPDEECLEVRRHFGLYRGLEEGQPERVKLQVRLYAGYHTQPENAADESSYVRQVQGLLGDLFSIGAKGSEVVRFENIEKYSEFKDFVQFLDDSRLGHSLVFQVDEFWPAVNQSSLADLSDYWNARTGEVIGGEAPLGRKVVKIKPDHEEDPGESFQPIKIPGRVKGKRAYFRRDFFLERSDRESRQLIPYVHDFGFLLARQDLWYRARHETIGFVSPREFELMRWGKVRRSRSSVPVSKVTVAQIWNALCVRGAEFKEERTGPSFELVTWGAFFSACATVAEQLSVPKFDIDLRTTETLLSLVLEVWWSEIYSWFEKYPIAGGNAVGGSLFSEEAEPRALEWWLENFGVFLYLAILRIIGGAPHIQTMGSQIRLRSADPESVATRHWYSTASVAAKNTPQLIPLRNPGFFSTCGDWFLACAAGSQSQLLCQQVIDKLVSRHMNLLRLHDGLGLPVRRIAEGAEQGNLRTALRRRDPLMNQSEPILLSELEGLGKSERTLPLRRSRILNYERDSIYFTRWIGRIIECREQLFNNKSVLSVLEVTGERRRYAQSRRKPASLVEQFTELSGDLAKRMSQETPRDVHQGWREFWRYCELLLATLNGRTEERVIRNRKEAPETRARMPPR